jgi:hypothetical protein
MENANDFDWSVYLQKQADNMMKDYNDLIEAANTLLLLRESKINNIHEKPTDNLCKLTIKKF